MPLTLKLECGSLKALCLQLLLWVVFFSILESNQNNAAFVVENCVVVPSGIWFYHFILPMLQMHPQLFSFQQNRMLNNVYHQQCVMFSFTQLIKAESFSFLQELFEPLNRLSPHFDGFQSARWEIQSVLVHYVSSSNKLLTSSKKTISFEHKTYH